MTSLTIELPEEQNAVLAAKARRRCDHRPPIGFQLRHARQVLQHDLASEWLQKSRASAKESGLDQLSIEEIEAEIAAARRARRVSRLQPGT